MVHQQSQFEHAASPDPAIRIVNEAKLTATKNAVRAFATALATNGKFSEAKEVERQLRQHKLDAAAIVSLISVAPAKK